MVFDIAFISMNEFIQKLYNSKVNSTTLIYESHAVYLELNKNLILSIFAAADSNIGLIYEIAEDLRNTYIKLSDEIEKLK